MKEQKTWSMVIVVKNEENHGLLTKIATICNVELREFEHGMFIVENPMPNQKNFEKFLNTIEDRNIVSYIELHEEEGKLGIILSDEEGK